MNTGSATSLSLGIIGVVVVMALPFMCGRELGRMEIQREQLAAEGCEQIAEKPELWECPDGQRVEVK